MGVVSMISWAIGRSAAVAAASEPTVILRRRASRRWRAIASVTVLASACSACLRLDGQEGGQEGRDDHDRTEEGEEHPMLLVPRKMSHTPPVR